MIEPLVDPGFYVVVVINLLMLVASVMDIEPTLIPLNRLLPAAIALWPLSLVRLFLYFIGRLLWEGLKGIHSVRHKEVNKDVQSGDSTR